MKRWAVVFCLSLSGCMVGPDYRPPETAMPGQFSEAQESVAAGDMCEWWKQFDDPQLDALIAEAIRGNFDMRIAVEKIAQMRGNYRVRASYLWPEIDLNAVAVRSRNSQNFFTSAGSESVLPTFQNFFQIGFDAIWEFDLFGKFRRSKRAAFDLWEASQENAQAVLITVISEVAKNYMNICSLAQSIDLKMKKIEADELQLLLTTELWEAGLSSEIPVEELVANLNSEKGELTLLKTDLNQAVYGLAVLLGRQPESLSFDPVRPIPATWSKVPVGLPSDLLMRRPDIRQAERELAAATEQIGVAKADLFPHISLTGTTFAGGQLMGSGYGYESGSLNKLFKHSSTDWSIGPAIRWDLIDFGRTYGNIAVQTSLQRQALLAYEQTVLNALKDVEGALIAYFDEEKREHFLKAEVSALEHSLQLTRDLFQAGLSNEQQVLIAKKALLDAQIALTGSQQALAVDLISLYKALGGSWECSYTP